MNLAWSAFKSMVDSKALSIQWIEDSQFYYLTILDGQLKTQCQIDKNPTDSADLADFETNYKAQGNASFSDIDGIPLMRLKASKKGWWVRDDLYKLTLAEQDKYSTIRTRIFATFLPFSPNRIFVLKRIDERIEDATAQ